MAIPLFTADEKLVLDRYFEVGKKSRLGVDEALDRLGVPDDVRDCTREAAGVGQILIQAAHKALPAWCTFDGIRLFSGRKANDRRRWAAVSLIPQHLFTVDWANAPGCGTVEAYYLIFVPGYRRYVAVAAFDGPEWYGCNDRAIGSFGENKDCVDLAGAAIRGEWSDALGKHEQNAWCCLMKDGLVSEELALKWRAQVFEGRDGDEDDCLDGCDEQTTGNMIVGGRVH